jgi:hypothetical protein
VDSPLSPSRPRSLRPWYLVAALLLTWIIGVRGFMEGCGMAIFLRSGVAPDLAAVAEQARDQSDPIEVMSLVGTAAAFRVFSDHQAIAFPLSVARALLGGLLVLASGFALGGRPGARGFALQVIAANLAFAAAEYALTSGVRGAWISAVAQAGALLPPDTPPRESLTNSALLWAWMRLGLALFMTTLGAAALALMRPRTKAYFQAVAQTIDRDDDEP